MRKTIYPLLAVFAVVVILISVASFHDGTKQQGQVLSGRATGGEVQKKVASQTTADPKDYLTEVIGLINQFQLLTEFPQDTEEQKQLAKQFANLHDQLLILSVPAAYRQFHLRLNLLTSQLSSALNKKDYQQFVSAQIKLQELADQYPQMFK